VARQWDFLLDGKGYMCWPPLREGKTPQWESQLIPKSAGDQVQIAEEERSWATWHAGFGFARFGAAGTYDYSLGVDPRRPGQLDAGPLVTTLTNTASGNIVGFFEQGSGFFAIASRYIQRVDLSNDDVETVDAGANGQDLDPSVATSATSFDGFTIVWTGNTTNAWTFEGTTWDEAATNGILGAYGAAFHSITATGADAYVLARSMINGGGAPSVTWLASGNTVDSTDWLTTPYTVGDEGRTITGLCAKEQTLWIGRTDGLWYVDRTGRAQRVLEPPSISDNNGKGMYLDSEGWLWFPCDNVLLRYQTITGETQDVTPGRGLSHETPIYGRVTCLRQYQAWRYAWIYNGTTSYLMCGRDRESGEPGYGPFIWHGALAWVTGEVTAAHITGLTTPPRLYYAVGAQGYYIEIDAPRSYAASNSVYLSADDGGALGTRWAPMGWVLDCEGCNSASYVTLYAKLDNGGYQKVGDAKASGRVWIPVPTGDFRYSRIKLRLDFTNTGTTTSPKVLGIVSRATRLVPTRDLITTQVVLNERVLSHWGVQTRRSGLTMAEDLEGLSMEGGVELVDWWTGTERKRQVKVLPHRRHLVREYGAKGEPGEVLEVADLTIAVLESESVVIDVLEQAKYGEAIYGTDTYS
jgi:hypothetical protein